MSTTRSSDNIIINVAGSNILTIGNNDVIVAGNINASGYTITANSILGLTSPVSSASFAETASYALNAGTSIDTGSFATTGSNTFNGSQTITGSLSINNLTSGSILFAATGGLISQDNSTFFWDNTNKTLKIGNSIPPSDNSAFKIQVTQVNSNSTIVATALTNTANEGPGITFARYRGTVSSPVIVDSEDRMGQFTFIGWDGAARQASSAILSFVDGAVSSGVLPSRIDFQTGTTGAGRATRLSIKNNGNILINTSIDAGYKLDVSGSVRFTDNLILSSGSSRLGVGITTPSESIHIQRDDVAGTYFRSDAFNGSPGLMTYRLNGTISSPTATVNNNNIGVWTMRGHNGTSYVNAARAYIIGQATETWTTSSNGAQLVFGTTTNGTTSSFTRLTIKDNGNFLINTTTDSGYKLDVSGSGRFTDGLTVTGSLNMIFTSGSSPQNLISVASQSITRFTLSNFGAASFTLNTSAVEAGNVNISTPSGFPGLQFFTSGSLNRFDAFNSGSLFVLGYRLINTYGTLAIFNTSHNVSIGYHASGSGFNLPPIDSGYKLLVSSSGVSGSFNANNVLLVSGSNVNINGNLIVSGSTTIGDATTDTITMTAATMSLGSGTGILNIDSNTFVVDGANNRVGIGKVNPNSALDVNGNAIITGSTRLQGGTLTDGSNVLSVVATMPSTITATNSAISFQITSAGSSSFSNNAIAINYLAGYTGSSTTTALDGANSAAGTGNNIFGARNQGGFLQANGTTTGTNIGFYGSAGNGDVNIGQVGRSITAKNSATNIGVFGVGLNTGTSPIQIGGYFGLTNSTPLFESAALIADNGAQTSDIFIARDSGSTVFKIQDGGSVNINGNLTITGSFMFATPSSPSFNGEIVRFGAGTLTTGQLYFLSSSGTWSLANADTTGSSTGMLGLAVGSSPTVNGLLIRGFAASSSYTYGTGSVVYMATGSGIMTATSPSSSNHVVRVMGYQTTLSNTIYFDPDKTWVTLA